MHGMRFLTRVVVVSLAPAVLIALAMGAGTPWSPERVSACSLAPLTTDALHRWVVPNSQIVATGVWLESSERVAVFRVTNSLKGSAKGEVLRVDNRGTFPYGFSCNPYDDPFREGFRFEEGKRQLLILEKEVDGLWQVAGSSRAAFKVPQGPSEVLAMDWGSYEGVPNDELPTLVDVAAAPELPSGVPPRSPNVSQSPDLSASVLVIVLVVVAIGTGALLWRRRGTPA